MEHYVYSEVFGRMENQFEGLIKIVSGEKKNACLGRYSNLKVILVLTITVGLQAGCVTQQGRIKVAEKMKTAD